MYLLVLPGNNVFALRHSTLQVELIPFVIYSILYRYQNAIIIYNVSYMYKIETNLSLFEVLKIINTNQLILPTEL